MSSEASVPVAIVGGGLVGMSLALALKEQGIKAEIFEARERGAGRNDLRILALSYGSQQTLSWLGAWEDLHATPIHNIHISQHGHFGRTVISAEEEGMPALGYVSAAHDLYRSLDRAIDAAGICYHANARVEAITAGKNYAGFHAGGEERRARLVAFAEGAIERDPQAGSRDYRQHAVTSIATVRHSHQGIAYERFTRYGPIALLPFGEALAVVHTCPDELAATMVAMPMHEYIEELQANFGRRVSFTAITPRHSFPLGLRYRRAVVAERQAWLGNAAQTLHPVAGQGFNLALRDVRELAVVLASGDDPGAAATLSRYGRKRNLDRRGAIGFTDMLARFFGNDVGLLGHVRGAGLLALDMLPAARSFVARRMIYGAHAWP